MCKHTYMYTHTYVSAPTQKLRSFSRWCFSGRTKLQGPGIRRNTRPMTVFSKCLHRQQECAYKKCIQKYQITLMFSTLHPCNLSPTFVHTWERARKSHLPWLSKQKAWPVIIRSSRRIQRNGRKKVSNPRCSLERGRENVKLSALPTLTGLGNSPRTHWNSSREQWDATSG